MKISRYAIFSSLFLFASTISAGSMGMDREDDRSSESPSHIIPFLSAEGGYSWNTLKGFSFIVPGLLDFSTRKTNSGGSGRIAAGLLIPYVDCVVFSSEMGWGYFGETKYRLPAVIPTGFAFNNNNTFAKTTLYGFDLLAGIYYVQAPFDIFLKAGALIENDRFKARFNIPALVNATADLSNTEALPEIKLGGSYHFNNDLSIFLDWTYAFGASNRRQAILGLGPTGISFASFNANLRNPTINAVLVGLQYAFV